MQSSVRMNKCRCYMYNCNNKAWTGFWSRASVGVQHMWAPYNSSWSHRLIRGSPDGPHKAQGGSSMLPDVAFLPHGNSHMVAWTGSIALKAHAMLCLCRIVHDWRSRTRLLGIQPETHTRVMLLCCCRYPDFVTEESATFLLLWCISVKSSVISNTYIDNLNTADFCY